MDDIITIKAELTYISKGRKNYMTKDKRELEEMIKNGDMLPDNVVVLKVQNFVVGKDERHEEKETGKS